MQEVQCMSAYVYNDILDYRTAETVHIAHSSVVLVDLDG